MQRKTSPINLHSLINLREKLPATKKVTLAVNNVLEQLADLIAGEEITQATLVTICLSAMQLVEHVPKLNGTEKKQVVLLVLKQLVTNHINDLQQKLILFNVIDNIIPVTIDTFVSVDNQKIKFHVRKCFSCCLTAP
jgi:hypothetical protein